MDGDKKVIWVFSGIAVFIVFIIVGLFIINKQEKDIMNKTASMPLTQTYYQDIQSQAQQAQKNAQKVPSNEELAEAALLKQVGLGGNDDAYPVDSVQDSDGIFIKQGILNGNGIPYNSDFDNSGNKPLAGIGDLSGANYWENIKNNDYNNMIAKAEYQIQQQNGSANQTADIKSVIERAKKDQEDKNNNLNAKNLKAQFIKKNKTIKVDTNKNNSSNKNSNSNNKDTSSNKNASSNNDKSNNTNSTTGKSSSGK